MLIENFDECVVKYLDKVARDAVENQEEIEDPRTFAHVKRAIEDRILDLLLKHTENRTVPPLDFFKKVVNTLANKYSYMFLTDPTTVLDGMKIRKFDQRGTGGVLGVEHIPKALSQKYRRLIDKMNSGKALGKRKNQEETEKKPKKARLPRVYGVDQAKFYSGDPLADDLVNVLETLYGVNEREFEFSRNRPAVQKLLTNSVDIHSSVPGFFDDVIHLKNQFEWLTNSSIVDKINDEVPRQFGLLKLVLEDLYPTQEFKLQAEAAKLKCGDRFGSKIPEYVFLLRELTMVWHSSRSGLIRTPEETAPSSPHIVFTEEEESYRSVMQL
jgi:hypothetical protein